METEEQPRESFHSWPLTKNEHITLVRSIYPHISTAAMDQIHLIFYWLASTELDLGKTPYATQRIPGFVGGSTELIWESSKHDDDVILSISANGRLEIRGARGRTGKVALGDNARAELYRALEGTDYSETVGDGVFLDTGHNELLSEATRERAKSLIERLAALGVETPRSVTAHSEPYAAIEYFVVYWYDGTSLIVREKTRPRYEMRGKLYASLGEAVEAFVSQRAENV